MGFKKPAAAKQKVYQNCGLNHEPTERGCHWIIIKDDGDLIHGYPFKTKSGAQLQMEAHKLSGYHLEHKFN